MLHFLVEIFKKSLIINVALLGKIFYLAYQKADTGSPTLAP